MDTMRWRFLDTGKGSAFFHMALDEAVFSAVRSGDSPPTIRVYEWETPSVTIGYSQKAKRVLDFERCLRESIPVTRRLTGGRAVFHADELTYSVSGPFSDPRFGGTLMDTYAAISHALLAALTAFGAPVDWSRGGNAGQHEPGVGASPCFLSASRYEITSGGKKLVGSAQRRIGGYFLQQGSILTGPGHERIADYMPSDVSSDEIRMVIEKKTVDLCAAMHHPVNRNDLKPLLAEAFSDAAGIGVFRDGPSPRELADAYRLMERYSSKGWVTGDGE